LGSNPLELSKIERQKERLLSRRWSPSERRFVVKNFRRSNWCVHARSGVFGRLRTTISILTPAYNSVNDLSACPEHRMPEAVTYPNKPLPRCQASLCDFMRIFPLVGSGSITATRTAEFYARQVESTMIVSDVSRRDSGRKQACVV